MIKPAIKPPLTVHSKFFLVLLVVAGLTKANASVLYYASDLTNKQVTGSANGDVTGTGASSVLTLTSARNQEVSYEFGDLVLNNVGDFLTANFNFSLDTGLATGTAILQFRLEDSTTGYQTFVSFSVNDPVSNNTIPGTTFNNNEGKFTSSALSTDAALPSSFSFTLTKTDTPTGLAMTFAGPLLASSPQTRDVTTIPASTTFDRIAFRFGGGLNTAGTDWRTPITVTFDDFSIVSNVPEPSTALLCGLGLGAAFLRRRRA